MSRYASEALVAEVMSRAAGICEYCRIAIRNTYFGGEIDHIKSLKHGGLTELSNLAYSCQPCNRNKGSDLGSTPLGSNSLVRFFNPRIDMWSEHFRISEHGEIVPLSELAT